MKTEKPSLYYWQCYPNCTPSFVTSFVVLARFNAMRPYAAVHMAGSCVTNCYDWREEVVPMCKWHWHQWGPLFVSDEAFARKVFEEQYNFFAKHTDDYKIVVGNLYDFTDKLYDFGKVKEAFRVGEDGRSNNEW